MPQPTLSELITSRQILRDKRSTGNVTFAEYSDLSVAIYNLDLQIAKLELAQATYRISQNGIGNFIITHHTGFPRYAACPCCDKPILSLDRAKILAKNLSLRDELQHQDIPQC